jgi:hypothetical protein
VTNKLYYGDNLEVLREHFADASVDLIYLDPPFNSNAGYNVLFKSASGAGADASIEAFDDLDLGRQRKRGADGHRQRDQPPAAGDDGRDALGDRREPADGLPGDDGGAAGRVAPRIEADGQPLSPLRPDREPLPQVGAGRGVWAGKFPHRD